MQSDVELQVRKKTVCDFDNNQYGSKTEITVCGAGNVKIIENSRGGYKNVLHMSAKDWNNTVECVDKCRKVLDEL